MTDVERRNVPRRVYETLTAEEAGALLPKVPAHWRGFFAAAVYAGLRKGECAGLRKSDVDLEGGVMVVRASYDHETTKGGHADTLPIPPPLLPFLEAGLKTKGPYVFPDIAGAMRTEESDPQIVLRRALAASGLVEGFDHICRRCKGADRNPSVWRHPDDDERRCPLQTCNMLLWPRPLPRKVRFHDLRHSCATVLLRAGVDIHRVQRILRHRDVRITSQTYAHLDVNDLKGAFATTWPSPSAPAPQEPQRAAVGAAFPATFRQTPSDPVTASIGSSKIHQRISEVRLERETGFEPATLSLGS